MSSQTELTLVLRMRNEAAEILRKHGEETSRIGSAYRLAARQVEVFRDSLQQPATGMASLTGMVRGVRADVADNPALSAWVAGDPDRTPQAEGDVVRERPCVASSGMSRSSFCGAGFSTRSVRPTVTKQEGLPRRADDRPQQMIGRQSSGEVSATTDLSGRMIFIPGCAKDAPVRRRSTCRTWRPSAS